MASTAHDGSSSSNAGARTGGASINPTVVTIAIAVVALVVSLYILQGQTAARID